MIAWLRADPAADRLLPRGTLSAVSAGFVVAVTAFFAVMVLALALAAGRLATTWAGEIADTATLQVIAPDDQIEAQARAALDVLKTTPGVRSVRMVDFSEQEKLLEPWLGADIPLESLPLPLLIEVSTDRDALNEASLEARLAAEAPGSVFDDHAAWRRPLVTTAERVRLFAFGCLGLLAVGLVAALGLAAQAAVASGAPVIRTLRLVGARDDYIARVFTRRLVVRAVIAASVGTAGAMLLLGMLPRSSEEGFFLVGIGLVGWTWVLPLLIPLAAGALAWLAMRQAARRGFRRWS